MSGKSISMKRKSRPAEAGSAKSTAKFAEMFRRAERSESFRAEKIKIEIAEQICLAMERQQVSRAELARRLGKSRAYISRVLQGSANFTLESLSRISSALSCRLELQFLPETSATPQSGFVKKLNPPGQTRRTVRKNLRLVKVSASDASEKRR